MFHLQAADTSTDDHRRQRLFAGDLFQWATQDGAARLCDFARTLAVEAFGDRDPQFAQFSMDVGAFVDVIGPLKRTFTNHPETKRLVQEILQESGCDLDATYFDLPRLRVVTAQGYLAAGMGYAYKLHRDTWYSSPAAQVNWWMPVYDVEATRSLRFYPDYFTQPVANSSLRFDYGEWVVVGRQQAAAMITADTRNHPLPLESVEGSPDVSLVGPQDTMFQFAGAHLHETVPNTSDRTRFSIDFRTVHIDDLRAGRAAPNVDGQALGTTLGDFMCASDFSQLPATLIAQYHIRR